MMFEMKGETGSTESTILLIGGELLVESDSSFNRQEIYSCMVSTRMWVDPKARAPGAPQRYTNLTAI